MSHSAGQAVPAVLLLGHRGGGYFFALLPQHSFQSQCGTTLWCCSPVAVNGLLWMEQDCSSQVRDKGLPITVAMFCITTLPGAGFLKSEVWVVP